MINLLKCRWKSVDITVSHDDSPLIPPEFTQTATFRYRSPIHAIKSELSKPGYQKFITFTGEKKYVNGHRSV